jgi:hypothetical protein
MEPLSLAVLRRLPLFSLAVIVGVATRDASALTRHDFPKGFVFGVGSSAFQVITPLLCSDQISMNIPS